MDRLLQFIPFLLVTKNSSGSCDEKITPKLNLQRVIEGVIIAAIAGTVSGYVSVAKLEVKVEGLHSEMKAVEARACEESKRQEKRIDDNLLRLERITELLGKIKR